MDDKAGEGRVGRGGKQADGKEELEQRNEPCGRGGGGTTPQE